MQLSVYSARAFLCTSQRVSWVISWNCCFWYCSSISSLIIFTSATDCLQPISPSEYLPFLISNLIIFSMLSWKVHLSPERFISHIMMPIFSPIPHPSSNLIFQCHPNQFVEQYPLCSKLQLFSASYLPFLSPLASIPIQYGMTVLTILTTGDTSSVISRNNWDYDDEYGTIKKIDMTLFLLHLWYEDNRTWH